MSGGIDIFPPMVNGATRLWQAYKSLVLAGASQPNINYSPTSQTSYSASLLMGNTITIGSNATINVNGTLVIMCDTLILNGVINGNGAAGSTTAASGGGYGTGGNGGLGVWVFARQILGTGQITSNGGNGGNAVTSTYAAQTYAYTGGESWYTNLDSGVSGSGSSGHGNSAGGGVIGSGGASALTQSNLSILAAISPVWLDQFNTITSNGLITPNLTVQGGGGGQGASAPSGSSTTAPGGGGGASPVAPGGNGTVGTSATGIAAGGAGGGAGSIMMFSENAIPALTLQSIGGNAGTSSSGSAGISGSGSGGLIGVFAPSFSGTTSVAAGTVPAGGNAGGLGTAFTSILQ